MRAAQRASAPAADPGSVDAQARTRSMSAQTLIDEKWCTACKARHPRSEFGRDSSRGDGLAARCLASRRTGRPPGHTTPPLNPATGRPGPSPAVARDRDKLQARQRINVEVRTGRRPHPNTEPCADCGHIWRPGERRHEYDHFLGYAARHHLDVQAVCTKCHRQRNAARGETIQSRGDRGRYAPKAGT